VRSVKRVGKVYGVKDLWKTYRLNLELGMKE